MPTAGEQTGRAWNKLEIWAQPQGPGISDLTISGGKTGQQGHLVELFPMREQLERIELSLGWGRRTSRELMAEN